MSYATSINFDRHLLTLLSSELIDGLEGTNQCLEAEQFCQLYQHYETILAKRPIDDSRFGARLTWLCRKYNDIFGEVSDKGGSAKRNTPGYFYYMAMYASCHLSIIRILR